MKTFILTIATLIALPLVASAQLTPVGGLRAGDTVRVWAVDPRLNGFVGAFDAIERDTLRIGALPAPGNVTTVYYSNLRRIDVRRGTARSPGRALLFGIIGGVAGLYAGAGLGVLAECGTDCSDNGEWGGLGGFLVGGALGIIGGTTTGIVIGARRRPAWQPVDLRR